MATTTRTFTLPTNTTIGSGSTFYYQNIVTAENEHIVSISAPSFTILQAANSEGYMYFNLYHWAENNQLLRESVGYRYNRVSEQTTVTIDAKEVSTTFSFRYKPNFDPGSESYNFDTQKYISSGEAPKTSTAVTFTLTIMNSYPFTITQTEGGTVTAYAIIGESSYVLSDRIIEQQTVRLDVNVNSSYRFIGWDAPQISIDANNKFVMPSEEIYITPIFERYVFDISIGQSEFGTASASAYSGEAGDTITLTAHPNTGYKMLGWDSSPYVEIINNSFTMPNYDVTITPIFKADVGYYNGSSYLPCIPMYYDGTNWIECDWKCYDGTNWNDGETI